MSIKKNLEPILNSLPTGVKLITVSKTKPNEQIMEAYDTGIRIFGESKPQELSRKWSELPKDIEWHIIGHLQTNKVKYIAPFVSVVHAVDSLKLLRTINKEALKNNRLIPFLFQMHIADEETKFGLSIDEIYSIINSDDFKAFENVKPVGLMGMATFTENMDQVRSEFQYLKTCFDRIKNDFFADDDRFKEISMGMSNDYKIAIEEGSTMVRIGSSIFGLRH
ncbi:MAG: YggS family pyridoxal phosphate-dependent enzyme [Bacteroidota bacterium]|nr:YggS family pyridoxal phosphate-dependent enzyme [Bacteroidota bacterium]